MISHELKCIFIHIPKTGGTSVEKTLFYPDIDEYAYFDTVTQDHRRIADHIPEPEGKLSSFLRLFRRPEEKSEEAALTPQQFQSYFKFCVVRNPWSRAFSWYRNVMDDPTHQKNHGVPADCTFRDFLIHHSSQFAMRPQTYWILDSEGNNPMDFIAHQETIDEDFATVCKKLKVEPRALSKTRMRPGRQPSYQDHYDDFTRDLVAERYSEEIELLGYRFEKPGRETS